MEAKDNFCTCDTQTYEEDVCPYEEEMASLEGTSVESNCTCCPYCRQWCAESI